MRVLLTSGAGFIGSHVADALLQAGHTVRLLDSVPALTNAGTSVLMGNITDTTVVAAAVDGVDVVIHHAAKVGLERNVDDMPDYVTANELGTATLLTEAYRRGVRHVVLASSMVVYGEGMYVCRQHGKVRPRERSETDLVAGWFEPRCPICRDPLQPGTIDEDAALEPRSVYAATKLAQESLSKVWARATGGNVIALRYHNVYGPGMPLDTPYAGVAALFRSAIRHGHAPRVFEDGTQQRDFVHVRDVARANVAAVAKITELPAGTFRAYNIASGRPRTVKEMADTMSHVMRGAPPVVTGEYRLGDVRHVVGSPDRAAHDLGFIAAVDLAEGIAELTDELSPVALASRDR
jgi:dTDP-L-rhamnose 4-epimerase